MTAERKKKQTNKQPYKYSQFKSFSFAATHNMLAEAEKNDTFPKFAAPSDDGMSGMLRNALLQAMHAVCAHPVVHSLYNYTAENNLTCVN